MFPGCSFLYGLYDFFAAPVRLWRMHKCLVQLNPAQRHRRNVELHRLQHTRRLQLRSGGMTTRGASNSTDDVRSSPVTPGAEGSPMLIAESATGLIQPLARMWLINVGLILLLTIISHLFSLLWNIEGWTSWTLNSVTFSVLSHMLSGLYVFLPVFTEVVNMLHLKWSVICAMSSSYRISQLINVFAVAFMYACYAIEYRWRQVPGRNFEGFLTHTLDHWTYVVGYGLPVGLGCWHWPDFIGRGGMFLAFTYPLLVIGALGAPRSWPHSATPSNEERPITGPAWLLRGVSRGFRVLLVLAMTPASFCTNLVLRGCVGVAYQLWF